MGEHITFSKDKGYLRRIYGIKGSLVIMFICLLLSPKNSLPRLFPKIKAKINRLPYR